MPDTGAEAGKQGILEDIKGKAKEVMGRIMGKKDVEEEGRHQQEKADAARDVASHEAQAEKARAEYEVKEAQQRADQAQQEQTP